MPDLVIVVSQRVRGTVQQGCQPGLAVQQRQSSQVLTVEKQQIEEKEDQRSLTTIGRVLYEIEDCPTVSSKF